MAPDRTPLDAQCLVSSVVGVRPNPNSRTGRGRGGRRRDAFVAHGPVVAFHGPAPSSKSLLGSRAGLASSATGLGQLDHLT